MLENIPLKHDLLTLLLCVHGAVGTVEELPLEELHGNDGENKHEELVHDEDIEDVLQRRDHAVKNSLWWESGRQISVQTHHEQTRALAEAYLEFRKSFDSLKRSQDSQNSEGLDRFNVSAFVVSVDMETCPVIHQCITT